MEFAQTDRIYFNTNQKDYLQKQKVRVKPDFLTPLKLGKDIPHPQHDYFNYMYGKPLDIRVTPQYHQPYYKHIPMYPTPVLLNETSNRLIDVLGVYYRNKDLPIVSSRR